MKMPEKYQVWWIPQIPMEAFYVPVESFEQGEWLCGVLADYDKFQFDNHIKPDYSNVGGVEYLDEDGDWLSIDAEEYEEMKNQ